jgi:hypothetical protein
MNMKRWFVWILLANLYACGDGSVTGPEPIPLPARGWLNVQLTTPNSDDGGIVFTVAGGPIDSVRFVHEGFSTAVSDSIWRFLATGKLSNGAIAQLLVPNVDNPSVYRPEIQEVAALVTYEQRDLAGYRLQVVKP